MGARARGPTRRRFADRQRTRTPVQRAARADVLEVSVLGDASSRGRVSASFRARRVARTGRRALARARRPSRFAYPEWPSVFAKAAWARAAPGFAAARRAADREARSRVGNYRRAGPVRPRFAPLDLGQANRGRLLGKWCALVESSRKSRTSRSRPLEYERIRSLFEDSRRTQAIAAWLAALVVLPAPESSHDGRPAALRAPPASLRLGGVRPGREAARVGHARPARAARRVPRATTGARARRARRSGVASRPRGPRCRRRAARERRGRAAPPRRRLARGRDRGLRAQRALQEKFSRGRPPQRRPPLRTFWPHALRRPERRRPLDVRWTSVVTPARAVDGGPLWGPPAGRPQNKKKKINISMAAASPMVAHCRRTLPPSTHPGPVKPGHVVGSFVRHPAI